MSIQSVISTPLPQRPHGPWARVFEYHKLVLAVLLGMFIGAQGVAVSYNLGWLEWRSAQLEAGQHLPQKPSRDKAVAPCPVAP